MPSNSLLFAVSGLWLAGAQIAAAQPARPQELPPSSKARITLEPVSEPLAAPSPEVHGPTIEAIEFRGATRVPQIALRAVIASRVGGAYDLQTLRHDSKALYATGRFSNVAWETDMVAAGAIVRFVVVERPLIRAIEFEGDDTVSISEILDRFERRKVNLRVETLFNDDELGRAAAAVSELVAEKSGRHVTVTPLVQSVWPHSNVTIIFSVSAGK